MNTEFVHLHLHTEYSLVNSVIRIKSLVDKVAEDNMPAVAVTDQSNLFAMVKFYRRAIQIGVKPIIGVDAWISNEDNPSQPYKLVFLCQNSEGYKNLTKLVSLSYTEGQHQGIPQIQKRWLQGHTNGLIALSGGVFGDVGQALINHDESLATSRIDDWHKLFPKRFYLELHRTGKANEEQHIHSAVKLAAATDIPVVATNDVNFLASADFDSHEARVGIHDGRTLDDSRRPKLYTNQQYLRTPEEMLELFSDIPEAIENTIHIATRCNLVLSLGENYLPNFPTPNNISIDEYLREQSKLGLEQRLIDILPADKNSADFEMMRKPYDERLQLELEVIINMGFPGYFLIVADFIKWAKNNAIPVGPGRGSGAGSLVAYALTITDLDPLKYELLFERFLNPERVSMPDFDIDFCMDGRDRVIDYVAERYGRDKVSQIITYGSMAAKAVVRDVGRVLGYPYGFVDQIAKLIPFEIGITLEKALEQEEVLAARYKSEEDVQTLIDLARKLEGLSRNAGKHAGGVVISPTQLTDFTPLYCEQGGESLVTQFDKDDVEAVGLVKFDFLGLRTLTIIDWALQIINKQILKEGEPAIDISRIPLDDRKAFELLKNCKTTAVFQLESRGMKDLIKRLQPDLFEDIIALVALFRPGPLQSGMVDDFINRKHGRAKVEYPHADLEPILSPTYGVILYQEQVMQIAQVLAGFSLGDADLLRRAMGKKKPEEMAKQRDIFTKGAVARSTDEKTATYVFDLMEKFAGYGFNKSHSAAYALLSYQTAWLKAHYTAAFMAAVMSADMDNTDKVVMLIEECRDLSVKVLPPNINYCEYAFTVKDNNTILYGLGAIKGVGEGAIENLRLEYKANGEFKDLFDFCQRIDVRKVNRRTFDALIGAGALDGLGPNRASLVATLSTALHLADQYTQNHLSGQNDMFGVSSNTEQGTPNRPFVQVKDWSDEQRLLKEKETLGLYLTGHPIERYEYELKNIISCKIVDLNPVNSRSIVLAGLIVAIRTMNTRKGDKMAFVTIDDKSGRVELAVFSDTYEKNRDMLAKDRVVVVEGEISIDDYTGNTKMSVKELFDVERAREIYAKRLLINTDYMAANNGFVHSLQDTLTPYIEGSCPVCVEYQSQNASVRLSLGKQWRIHPTDELINRLIDLVGKSQIKVEYR